MRPLSEMRLTGPYTHEEQKYLQEHSTDPKETFRTIQEILDTGVRSQKEEDQIKRWENRPLESWHVVQEPHKRVHPKPQTDDQKEG